MVLLAGGARPAGRKWMAERIRQRVRKRIRQRVPNEAARCTIEKRSDGAHADDHQ